MAFPRWLASLVLCVFLAAPVCASVPAMSQEEPAMCAPPTSVPAPKQETVAAVDSEPVLAVRFDADISTDSREKFEAVLATVAKLHPQAMLLVFNSKGGDVSEGMRIARDMEGAPFPVFCVVDGEASSMGFYILQSCKGRYMTRRSTLMQHEPYNAAPLRLNRYEHEQWATSLRVTALAMAEHETKKLLISKDEFIARMRNGDYEMTWQEGLKIGAVDETFQDVEEAIRSVRAKVTASEPVIP